ncbi:hypothetical protein CSA17_05785 [bacterium DOLJORAL78_65_58]|nr:MAG: hypothetical protein CSA17_05785 [bacterium DOLJORAL78_65_58]
MSTGVESFVLNSANARFKAQYPKYLRWATLAAFILTALIWALFPDIKTKPYKLRQEEFQAVDIEDQEVIDIPPPPQEAPPPPKVIEAAPDDEVTEEVEIHWQKPVYPEIARKAQMEGTVLVKVLVGPDGSVKNAQIIQGVNPILDKAALAAALKCKFIPGKQRNIPVKAQMALPFSFRLH